MDSNNTKQMIIAYYTAKKALGAILNSINIELEDSETVAKMPKDTYDTLYRLECDCEDIQDDLKEIYDYICPIEKDLDTDEEITATVDRISDIIYNVKPKKKIPSQPAFDEMDTIAKLAGYPVLDEPEELK